MILHVCHEHIVQCKALSHKEHILSYVLWVVALILNISSGDNHTQPSQLQSFPFVTQTPWCDLGKPPAGLQNIVCISSLGDKQMMCIVEAKRQPHVTQVWWVSLVHVTAIQTPARFNSEDDEVGQKSPGVTCSSKD